MSDTLIWFLERLAKVEGIGQPPSPEQVGSTIDQLLSDIDESLHAAELRERSLELAIELNEEEIAADIDAFWRNRPASTTEPLPYDATITLRNLVSKGRTPTVNHVETTLNDWLARIGGKGKSKSENVAIETDNEAKGLVAELSNVSYFIQRDDKSELKILKNANAAVKGSKLIAIVGANGCGKTTTLSLLAGIVPTSKGEVLFPEIDARASTEQNDSSRLGCLDLPHIAPWATRKRAIFVIPSVPEPPVSNLRATLASYAAHAGLQPKHREIAISLAQNRYGLWDILRQSWHTLSSGERVRFAIACGSVLRPPIMLMDEPLAPLDESSRIKFIADMQRISQRTIRPTTVVFSTHNVLDAEKFCDEVYVLSGGSLSSSASLNSTYCGGLFRLGLEDSSSNTEAIDRTGLEHADLGGWVFLRTPKKDMNAADVARILCNESVQFSSLEDLSRSGIRPQIEEAIKGNICD